MPSPNNINGNEPNGLSIAGTKVESLTPEGFVGVNDSKALELANDYDRAARTHNETAMLYVVKEAITYLKNQSGITYELMKGTVTDASTDNDLYAGSVKKTAEQMKVYVAAHANGDEQLAVNAQTLFDKAGDLIIHAKRNELLANGLNPVQLTPPTPEATLFREANMIE